MADLPSILGGMAQGFLDFGKSAVDLFGTGGAAVGDLVDTIRTGKVSTKNQDDFRKWLYNTDSVQDAAAKGLGTALNGVQTVTDYIPGIGAVTRNPLFNAGQGALGGLADEFKTYGKDYDLGRAGQRAAVSAGAALASGSLGDALKKSASPLLSSGAVQGLARGATSGAISGGGYAAIDGGDVLEAAKQGAGMGALIGGATGAFQDFRPAKASYDVGLTDDEKAARIANAKNMLANEQNPERIAELNNQIKDLGGTLADADMAVNSPKLTPEQEAYFKDSVIREPGGGLKTVYHGTDADFNTFGEIKTEPGYWFTEDKDYAASHGKNLKTVNLNMKNPLDLNTTEGDNKLVKYLRECFGENASESDIYTKKFRSFLKSKGYDGMIWEHSGKNTYIAFEPNQIKNTNNLNPTENPDIRYSKATPGQSLEKTLANGDAEINRVGSANVAPVDPATLPESMRAVKGYIDKDYIKDIEKYAGKKYADMSDSELLEYALSKRKPEDRDIMRVAYEDMIKGGSSARKIAESTAKNNYLSAIGETEYSDASGDGLMEYLLHHGNQIGNDSRTKAADIELSDRLGIAPGNTFMRDNANPYDSYGSYSPYDTTISIGNEAVGENAIGTIGHERLHSFQTEALMNRYDKEVLDAYRDLSKDLDKYIKNDAEIAKLHADDPADLAYWGNKDEQQARMLQQYLENKRFTNTGSIRNRAKEWGNEINPAFDKFFDKLRDLSKRGVALPAITALLGGGAYMASQNNDKEKEVK